MGHTIEVLGGLFAVCRAPADAEPPALDGAVWSLSRSPDELSAIVEQDRVSPIWTKIDHGWRCLRVRGPLPFDAVGVLASLVAPLAEASISIMSLSTYDTDYLWVKADALALARAALEAAGHRVLDQVERLRGSG